MPNSSFSIPQHRVLTLLGEGACGETHLASASGGGYRAVKFFKTMAINRHLLVASHERLLESGGHEHVVACHGFDFDARPAWIVMDYHGECSETEPAPWTLESWLSLQPEPSAGWPIIRQIAEGMAFLHRIGIPHANLHPRNVLITDPEEVTIAVSDFSQGWIGGIYNMDPDDAMLYAAPEQLRQPEGIDHGAWGGWDVFAFGMLAFRMLTGRFAYANDIRIARENAWRRNPDGTPLTPEEIAEDFDTSPSPRWGDDPADWEEEEKRRLIENCLATNPDARFNDMREVLAEFERIDEERTLREERMRVLSLRRKEARSLSIARTMAGFAFAGLVVATLAALVFAHKFHLADGELTDLRVQLSRSLREKETEIRLREEEALRREAHARAEAAGAARETSAIRETLVRSQEQADRLFAIIRDRKPPNHPGFQDLTQTASDLTQFYEDFHARVLDDPSMRMERARAADNLSDLAAIRGENEAAAAWRRKAASSWEELVKEDPEQLYLRKRLANSLLKLAQRDFATGDLDTAAASVTRARGLLTQLAEERPHDDDILRHLAASFLQTGKLARQKGNADEAFTLYRQATDILSDLSKRTGRLDYRSKLANSYVDLGELARGLDDLDKAESVQRAALAQLLEMLEEKPDLELPRFDLARAYGELGEIECEIGDPEVGEKNLEKSMEILKGLLTEKPEEPTFLFQKARRLTEFARKRRDQGKGAEAETLVDQSTAILKRLAKDHPENPFYTYQLALVEWQHAELLTDLSKHDEAVQLMHTALNRLDALLANKPSQDLPRQQIQMSMAYLVGDLAHQLEEAKKKEEALEAFRDAERRWKEISSTYGEDDVILDALTWCRRRIAEIEAP